MRARLLIPFAFLAVLASCSDGESGSQGGEMQSFDVAEQPLASRSPESSPSSPASPVEVALPQIAYVYSYTFRLPSDAVGQTQERHVELCERLGPARCRVIDLKRSAGSGDYVAGSLKLQVAAPVARAFGNQIVETATGAGAETVDRGIAAEDLSKQIVDTAARIRTKEVLVDRLTTLLETRSGNIAQAVEAERAINGAQEELEQARSWLAEMRGRVAMSTFEINYQSGAPLGGGFSDPLREAFAGIGALFGRSLALIITLIAAILPWALLLALLGWLYRLLASRLRRGHDDGSVDREAGDQDEADSSPPSGAVPG